MLLAGLEQLAEAVGAGSCRGAMRGGRGWPTGTLGSAALPPAPCPPLHCLMLWRGAWTTGSCPVVQIRAMLPRELQVRLCFLTKALEAEGKNPKGTFEILRNN